MSAATAIGQQGRGHHAGAVIVEGLHAVVDGDAQRPRLARQVAADHQHHAELAERMREGQDGGRQDARPRQRHFDAEKALPRRQPTTGRRLADVARHGLEAALDRLDDERDVGDRRREQQTRERERQRVADDALKRAPSGERAPNSDEQVEAEHRRAAG